VNFIYNDPSIHQHSIEHIKSVLDDQRDSMNW